MLEKKEPGSVKSVCVCHRRQKGASPGIEPGPPAPKAGILPLNYKASVSLGKEKGHAIEGVREKKGCVTVSVVCVSVSKVPEKVQEKKECMRKKSESVSVERKGN